MQKTPWVRPEELAGDETPEMLAAKKEIANLLRKLGGKTGIELMSAELKAAGN